MIKCYRLHLHILIINTYNILKIFLFFYNFSEFFNKIILFFFSNSLQHKIKTRQIVKTTIITGFSNYNELIISYLFFMCRKSILDLYIVSC